MGYWTGADLPFTYGLASTFPIGDRWFCSLLGQTDPNRRYLDRGHLVRHDRRRRRVDHRPRPPRSGGTIFDRLGAYGISSADYVAQLPRGPPSCTRSTTSSWRRCLRRH